MRKQRVVVIGHGMAGARVVEEILRRVGPDRFEIALFGEEHGGSYDRMRVADVMNGSQTANQIQLQTPAWYHRHLVRVHEAERAIIVSRSSRTVYGGLGTEEYYDKLVFATGSSPHYPSMQNLFDAQGERLKGVFAFRALGDCERIMCFARRARTVAVVGGGVLALEAARGLAAANRDVHLIHNGARLMHQHLDEYAARVVQDRVGQLGITVHLRQGIKAISGVDCITGLELSDGSRVDCDLLVVSTGLIPNTWLAYQCGLSVERGIAVDRQQAAVGDRHVYALGECAQYRATIHGSDRAIEQQSRVIADQLTGADPNASYDGAGAGLKLSVMGIQVASIGTIEIESVSDRSVEICSHERGVYRKLVLRDERVVGAVLVGDVSGFDAVRLAFERRSRLSEWQVSSLLQASEAREVVVAARPGLTTSRASSDMGCSPFAAVAWAAK